MQDNSLLKIKNEIRHERDFRHLWRCVLGVFGGILIAVGFAFAAQQHFTALQCSVRNVEMQKELERLKKEQKRLIFEREMASSPAQLENRARRIGLQTIAAQQINRFDENELAIIEPTENAQTRHNNAENLETASLENQVAKAN